MDPFELAILTLLAATLLALAGYSAWRQARTLRQAPHDPQLSTDDRRYILRQAWRRLFCALLMALLAGMLLGSWVLDQQVREMREEVRSRPAVQERAPGIPPEYQGLVEGYAAYWIVALLLFLLLLIVAAVDAFAIARYSLRKSRQLQKEQFLELEREVRHLRKGSSNGQI